MASLVPGLSPRPRLHPCPGPGYFLGRSLGLDLEPRLSGNANNCIRIESVSRVSSAGRRHQAPLPRSPPQPGPPARPRSPTPRAGRRLAHRKPGQPRKRSAQCAAQPGMVAPGNRKARTGLTHRKGSAACASGRVPGEHCRPADTPVLSSLPPRSPTPRSELRPAPSDWNPRPRSLEPQNFPSPTLSTSSVHFHPTPLVQPSFPHLPASLQTP